MSFGLGAGGPGGRGAASGIQRGCMEGSGGAMELATAWEGTSLLHFEAQVSASHGRLKQKVWS